MGKVKPINQYRLTPGFGGLALCHIKQQSAALHAAGAASKRKPPNNAVSYTQIPTRGFVMSVSLL